MIWLGYKEFIRRIFTNIFIALQLAAMLFIVISIVSSVNSRTELYLPIKDKLEGDGLYLQASQITFADVATEEELLKLHPEIKDVTCAYTFSFLEKENSVSAYSMAYSDEIIEMYEPKLKSGKWFNLKNNDDDVLYAITDDKHGLDVGDRITMTHAYYPDDDYYSNWIEEEYEVEIIGVCGEKSMMFGMDRTFTERDDFRNLYGNYSREETLLLFSASQLESKGINLSVGHQRMLINYEDGLSQKQIEDLNMELYRYGQGIELRDFSRVSKLYVYNQIVQLFPILVCIALLLVVSTISVSTLNTKLNLHTFAIYYTLGCTWKKCLGISFVNAFLTSVVSVLMCVVFTNILKINGTLGNTVFEFGMSEFLWCLATWALFILCSIISPLICINTTSPKENLRANE